MNFFDCKGGPGTTEPACGACVTCLHRVIEAKDAHITRLQEAGDALTNCIACGCNDGGRRICRETEDNWIKAKEAKPCLPAIREQKRIQAMTKPIRIWRFKDAPKRYRISIGGDEDWVAFVPAGYQPEWIGWLDEGTSFGCCKVKVFHTADGGTIHIGAHA